MKKEKRNPNKTSLHLRLSTETKNHLEELKELGNFKTFEETILAYISQNGTEVKKVFVDEGGHCLKLMNKLIKYSTNLNQMAKIANQQNSLSLEEIKKFQQNHLVLINAKRYLTKNVKILKKRL
jgi:glutathionylspermidine synthase